MSQSGQLGINFEACEAEYVSKWKKRAEKSVAQAGQNANDAWKEAVYGQILEVARRKETFTSYDVWLRSLTLAEKTHDGRAIGIVIRQAQANGVMVPTGQYFKNPNRNGSPAPIYRSQIFKQDRLQTLLAECYERAVQ